MSTDNSTQTPPAFNIDDKTTEEFNILDVALQWYLYGIEKYRICSKGRNFSCCMLSDLGADDIEVFSVVVEIEKIFNVYIPEEFFSSHMTVGDFSKSCVSNWRPV